MIIAIGSDHWGVQLKRNLTDYLQDFGIEVKDFGAFSPEPVDYPDIALLVAESVAAGSSEKGILICRTGLGMAIAANKVPGIRAASVHDTCTAQAAAASNNAQIITMGCENLDWVQAGALVTDWLVTPFKGGASAAKVRKIMRIESSYLINRSAGMEV